MFFEFILLTSLAYEKRNQNKEEKEAAAYAALQRLKEENRQNIFNSDMEQT